MCNNPISLEKTYVRLHPINWAYVVTKSREAPHTFSWKHFGCKHVEAERPLRPTFHNGHQWHRFPTKWWNGKVQSNSRSSSEHNSVILFSNSSTSGSHAYSPDYIVCAAGKVWESRICQVPILLLPKGGYKEGLLGRFSTPKFPDRLNIKSGLPTYFSLCYGHVNACYEKRRFIVK